MQGVAQQLILDRRVGSYELPDGWFVRPPETRKEDLGPPSTTCAGSSACLVNRFLHLDVTADLDSFRRYVSTRWLDERIASFLAFRPSMLHALDPKRPAWPSPRSWEMANTLIVDRRIDCSRRGRRRSLGVRRVLRGVQRASRHRRDPWDAAAAPTWPGPTATFRPAPGLGPSPIRPRRRLPDSAGPLTGLRRNGCSSTCPTSPSWERPDGSSRHTLEAGTVLHDMMRRPDRPRRTARKKSNRFRPVRHRRHYYARKVPQSRN